MFKSHQTEKRNRFSHLSFIHLCIVYMTIGIGLFSPPTRADENFANRASLAISGGASMGAYEAGLIWGIIEVLKHSNQTQSWSAGGQVQPFEISSIAGTSAGGINTLLAAIVWSVNPESEGGFSNRIDDNVFRDVWLTPDINRFLPPDADSPLYLPDDALLSRADLVQVAREIRDKWDRKGTFRPGLQISLGLTVTRVRPEKMTVSGITVENQRFYIPIEMRTGEDGSAHFGFNPKDYPQLQDPSMLLMPWPAGEPPYSISDQQIEVALLTTSAFPIGLGRKRLQYCRKLLVSIDDEDEALPPVEAQNADSTTLQCPEGFALSEGEFADGGLFDNLPIGLARQLSESSRSYKSNPSPIKYIYLDPERTRYETRNDKEETACQGDNPPEACRELTYNLASEMVVLGGAVGTARKYELYKELTGDKWKYNLPDLCRQIADTIDVKAVDNQCDSLLPFFSQSLGCSDRLRYAARLLDMSYVNRETPIFAPISESVLLDNKLALSCTEPSESADPSVISNCQIDTRRFRTTLWTALVELSKEVYHDDDSMKKEIQRSAASIESDRVIHMTSRGNPITGLLLDSFGAFLDYKFREYDYHAGIYDSIVVIADSQCSGNYPFPDQHEQWSACMDRLTEGLYTHLGVPESPKAKYAFALMARHEFGTKGALHFAYEPMPQADRDTQLIFDALKFTFLSTRDRKDETDEVRSPENIFFSHLSENGFEPTQPLDGSRPLLKPIMEEPDYWSYELINRATDRLMLLEIKAEEIYEAREPDPEKRDHADTTLMGAGSLALRTATYKYPDFAFAPSTAPDSWFWRNIIPYEAAFDLIYGDTLFFWQPTWNFNAINAGFRMGLGFTGGLFNSNADENRENYGVLGIDLTGIKKTGLFSGFGITPALYHNWQKPEDENQTTFGLDAHVTFFKNRLRISVGARDIVDRAGDTLFLTVNIADLPGLIYWTSR